MNLFVVNEPYPIPLSGTEGFHYLCQDTGHLLCLGLRCPRLEEIEAIHGRTEFAVAVKDDLVHLLCRFGHNLPWNRVVASCHMTPPEVRWIPEDPKPGEGGLIHIHLVDSSTNILRAMRALSFSTEFTRVFHKALRDDAQRPFNETTFMQAVHRAEKWAQPEWMLTYALARFRTKAAAVSAR